jgi:hypothetical protein
MYLMVHIMALKDKSSPLMYSWVLIAAFRDASPLQLVGLDVMNDRSEPMMKESVVETQHRSPLV